MPVQTKTTFVITVIHPDTQVEIEMPGGDMTWPVLTQQEKKVLVLICQQNTAQEIADKLFISKYTVMRHKQNIKEKIGAKSPVGLLLFAVKCGLVRVDEIPYEQE
jgi:DNA-binding CsgD family transcriptional regulator